GGDGVTHRLWAVYDPAFIEDMKLQFATRRLYIADGHHRYETALNYRRETHAPGSDYVMMTLVDMDSPGLLVLPTHRVVRDLPDFDGKAVLGACREYFEILEINPEDADLRLRAVYEKGKKSFVYYYGGKAFLLTLNNIAVMDGILPGKSASSRGLDVAVLHSLILERILKIDRENMANQVNLKYTREIGEAILAVDKGANCAFLLNPTRVQEIRDVAVAGEKMPQKSTYFYPKLITGLVMNKLDT
ncbi:MAG: DUF1015 domain-containing protein, partial [Oscillospiraceae bacterium]|nr:DUF1015 domain-containing protein [Oscillospiraceae bacterium]